MIAMLTVQIQITTKTAFEVNYFITKGVWPYFLFFFPPVFGTSDFVLLIQTAKESGLVDSEPSQEVTILAYNLLNFS